jgi:folate-binding protein YgfZ
MSHEFAVLGVEGPMAQAVVKRLFLTGAVALPKDHFGIVVGTFEKFELTVINNTGTGDDGYHIVVPADEVVRIREYLIQAARGSDGLPVGHTVWNIRRVENGIPWFGVDYTSENFPPESRLDHTVSYTKGCFRGQEPLGRIHNRGDVRRLLVGLTAQTGADTGTGGTDAFQSDVAGELEKMTVGINELVSRADENGLRARANTDAALFDLSAAFPAGSEIFAGGNDTGAAAGKPQGRITSAVLSPRLKGCLLLGYVRRETVESNTAIELQLGEKRESMSVINLPPASPAD